MDTREQELREGRSDECEEHVPLRVPGIALRAEKIIRRIAREHGSPSLEELVTRAEGQAHADHEKIQPATALKRHLPQQQLTREDGWNETLREVADAVVMVARQPKRIPRLLPQWHLRVGVMAPQRQDERMQGEQMQAQRREREAPVRGGQ